MIILIGAKESKRITQIKLINLPYFDLYWYSQIFNLIKRYNGHFLMELRVQHLVMDL